MQLEHFIAWVICFIMYYYIYLHNKSCHIYVFIAALLTLSNLNMCFHAMTLVNTFGTAYTRLVWDAAQVKTIYLKFCAMYRCN